MPQMKAIRFEEFGGPEVLRHVDAKRPEAGTGEVLVEVGAAGVNFADTAQRRDAYLYRTPLPYVPGYEAAGTVAEVGEGVEGVSRGDRVLAVLGSGGGYAGYAVAPADSLIPLPEGVGPEEAAAVPIQGLTAYHTLATAGRLGDGETVLVHAAAGGVGTLAVQMAKLMGAGKVIATASTQGKLDLAGSLGADVLVNYAEDEGWPERVREATEGRGADVILEMVGGPFVRKNLSCLAPFGRMVAYGAASGEPGGLTASELIAQNQAVVGFYVAQILGMPELLGPSLQRILGWLASGDLEVSAGHRYPLSEAARAHADLEGRKTTGKIVLLP